MANYHGGKQKTGYKIAKCISDIYTDLNINLIGYCEPFCGMLGVYRYIPELIDINKFKAGDINESVIKMWNGVKNGWKPPIKVSKIEYEKLKLNTNPSKEKGFIGHQYSYGGQYFMGFRGDYGNKTSYHKASQNVIDIAKELKKVKFTSGEYTQFSNLKNYIIYCDPPYKDTSRYTDELGVYRKFDDDKFWKWINIMSKNNMIFITEYKNPPKYVKYVNVLTLKYKMTGETSINRNRNEKLFLILP